jgi:hypothetical protein
VFCAVGVDPVAAAKYIRGERSEEI